MPKSAHACLVGLPAAPLGCWVSSKTECAFLVVMVGVWLGRHSTIKEMARLIAWTFEWW